MSPEQSLEARTRKHDQTWRDVNSFRIDALGLGVKMLCSWRVLEARVEFLGALSELFPAQIDPDGMLI